jgi:hypothetical protein
MAEMQLGDWYRLLICAQIRDERAIEDIQRVWH